MSIKIALAGNPNCGKTTLFNALTGSNQFVGNWPGVTVEKKEGKLKKHDDIIITDLPGIYSLSPYTLEEVVARNYLLNECPDAILNIVDGTNLERNLYLTTQLAELGIPVVVAINMMDVVRKRGDIIDIPKLSKALGCRILEISALKSDGIIEAAEAAIEAARSEKPMPHHMFSGPVEHALAHIEEAAIHEMEENRQRWYSIKIFERDTKILEQLQLPEKLMEHIEHDIAAVEDEFDDDAEAIITNERYNYITRIISGAYFRKNAGKLTVSDKIDRIVTNRILGLPIFALIMIAVYFVSVTTVGKWATDWANDGVFGDGWFISSSGKAAYERQVDDWAEKNVFTQRVKSVLEIADQFDVKGADRLLDDFASADLDSFEENYSAYADGFYDNDGISFDITAALGDAVDSQGSFNRPDPADSKGWVKGVPVIVAGWLDSVNCAPWLRSLVLDGIIGGVGSVLGFVPQMLVLFMFLAFLEACGYMSRVAFLMDRIFRRFGLSGKSFIPILIGTGCGVPGIMASRTIENVRDRRMTIITTTFIPCGAKIPVISMIAGVIFGGAWWVAPSAYFMGMAAIIISGLILKKTRLFVGEASPFVMELPAYHMPTPINVFRSMWERGWSFIKKAGTVILLASVVIWAGSRFGWSGGSFGFSTDMALTDSILGKIGSSIKWIFAPLGFGNEIAAIATVMGLMAKEEIVGVFGVLGPEGLTKASGYAFLAFNLLCAPCIAAMSAIRREMNSPKWTAFAIGYQCLFAYLTAFCVFQLGSLFSGNGYIVGSATAFVVIGLVIWMLFRPYEETVSTKKSDDKSDKKEA